MVDQIFLDSLVVHDFKWANYCEHVIIQVAIRTIIHDDYKLNNVDGFFLDSLTAHKWSHKICLGANLLPSHILPEESE